MNIDRLRWDLKLLEALKRQGVIRDYDYSVKGVAKWLNIFGAFQLPLGKFNYPDVNLKLPIPDNIYEPSSKGRFHFYDVILIDSKLRIRGRNGWEHIQRQIKNMYPEEEKKQWSLLCVIPHDAFEDTDLRSIIALTQDFVLRNGGE